MRGSIAIGMPRQAPLAGPVQTREIEFAATAEWMHIDTHADQRQFASYPASVQGQEARISSSSVSALSSFVFSASASSLTRICRALASMRFSPAESPRSRSRRHRSRTTSATLLPSPEASFSRLALYRRDQLVGSSVNGARRTSKTFSRPSWPTTSLTPTSSALSDGTRTVRSPLSTLSTRYVLSSPLIDRISISSIRAAPWWGYTTVSPTLKVMWHVPLPLRLCYHGGQR